VTRISGSANRRASRLSGGVPRTIPRRDATGVAFRFSSVTNGSLGLSGYVPKEEDGPSLLAAVDAVQHNQTYFPA
jgi:hypothetical protein